MRLGQQMPDTIPQTESKIVKYWDLHFYELECITPVLSLVI